MMQFELPQESGSIIKVIGVGGGGSNAVNHMYRLGIKGVDFIVCNTDKQALEISPVPNKIQLGFGLTKGLGAGSIPEMGKNSALETIDEIRRYLSDGTQMVFITAGLGGGTGTGAAPIIASVARELGILSVGIVTIPFVFEGKKRRMQAEQGLEEMKKYVDTLLVIGNDKLREIYGNLKMSEAFAHADNVLTNAAKAIAEIISINLHVNVDFNDVKTVMKDSGVAIMGSAIASGDKRALKAVENALNSPLLNDNNIKGARHVLLNIMSGNDDITMDEFGEITDFIQEESGYTAELITGYGIDASLGDNVSVTIIATGFQTNPTTGFEPPKKVEKVVNVLDDKPVQEVAPTPAPVNLVDLMEEKKSEEPFLKVIPTPVQAVVTEVPPMEMPKAEIPTVAEPILVIKKVEEPSLEIPEAPVVDEEPKMEVSIVTDYSCLPIPEPKFIEDETPLVEEMKLETKQIVFKEPSAADNAPKAEMSQEEMARLEREERIRAAQERIKKLKDITMKLKTPEGLMELEREPSFQRNGVKLNETNPSEESKVSRYTLSEGDDKRWEIRPNNSFLHDQAD